MHVRKENFYINEVIFNSVNTLLQDSRYANVVITVRIKKRNNVNSTNSYNFTDELFIYLFIIQNNGVRQLNRNRKMLTGPTERAKTTITTTSTTKHFS